MMEEFPDATFREDLEHTDGYGTFTATRFRGPG
jgi:hypothetical protein